MLYSGSSSIGHECKSSVPLLLFCLEQIWFWYYCVSLLNSLARGYGEFLS